jgi:hypothetical protein
MHALISTTLTLMSSPQATIQATPAPTRARHSHVQVDLLYPIAKGFLLRAVGDVDADGVQDYLATVFFGGYPSGDLVSGALGTPLLTNVGDPTAGLAYQGITTGRLGDIDGDGVPDYALGSPFDAGVILQSGVDGATLAVIKESSSTSYGAATAPLGDRDGDGKGEFAVSAPDEFLGGSAGLIRLYDGQSLSVFDVLLGEVGSAFGAHLLAVSDRTGDGLPELLVAAPMAFTSRGLRPGEVLLVDPVSGATLLTLEGSVDRGRYGTALAEAADLNSDGVVDYVIGSPQPFGSAAGRLEARSGANGALLWSRDGSLGDVYGNSVAVLGDVDGDGLDDVAVGAPQDWLTGIGPCYVELLSGTDGSVLARIEAQPGALAFGDSLEALGDVDGDGSLELVVGSRIPFESLAHVYSARLVGPVLEPEFPLAR